MAEPIMEKPILEVYGVYRFNKFPHETSVVIGVERAVSGNLMVSMLQFLQGHIFAGFDVALHSDLVKQGYLELGEVFNSTNGWMLTLENYHDHE